MAEEKCPSGAYHRGYSTEQPFCLYYSLYYRHQKIEINFLKSFVVKVMIIWLVIILFFSSLVDVLPYQIGLVFLGVFALCVLVLDMIMCAKGQGVIYKVGKKCCLSDHNRGGNRGEMSHCDRQCTLILDPRVKA